MRRRDFIKSAGCFVATASMGGLVGCGSNEKQGGTDGGLPDGGTAAAGSYRFVQGVSSGDPRPGSVMLWTRVEATSSKKAASAIALRLEVAMDSGFKKLVLHKALQASSSSDHTVRVLVDGLAADSLYYYRFVAGVDESRTGRTWTAPEPAADVPVRFAWASCQDYSAGFYGAYRRMINDDEAAADTDRLRFVLFIGDFIYETIGQGFQTALDDDLQMVDLKDQSGKPREVPALPSGGGMLPGGNQFAQTVDDYRHLYKTFLSDPDLQEARARWPFVSMWDDHEFSDDCWQTQANYTDQDSFDEPSQQRKVAANQAWFEFVPAILSEAEQADGVKAMAKDFAFAKVEDVQYSEPVDVSEPNNAKALATLTTYRRLRFGKHVEIVLSDNRTYRSDHALAENVTISNPLVFNPRAGLSLDAVNAFDAGKTANDGNPPDLVNGFQNTRKDSPPGTMLGAAQKQWWKDVMQSSTATWKVWGNSVPIMRIRLDATNVTLFPGDLVLSADGWDGYPSERRELMSFLAEQGIRNVVSLSGDHHAHFAGLIDDDFDGPAPKPVMADFCAAAISSTSEFASVAGAIGKKVTPALASVVGPVLELIVYDSTPLGGKDKAVVNLNALIRYGSGAAMAAAKTNDLAMVEAARNPAINSHLRYADTAASGYGLATFDGQGAQVTLVTIEKPIVDRGKDGAMLRGKAAFMLPVLGASDDLVLGEPELTGKKPFPLA